MTASLNRLRPEIPTVVAATALVALAVLPVWPGVYTLDSHAIYDTGLKFRISNWYCPVIAALWGLGTRLGSPTPTALVLQVTLIVGSLLALYRLVLGRWTSIVAASVTTLWPPVYGLVGWVGRDVWFLGLMLCALAGLGWMTRLRRPPWPLSLLTMGASWLAADARQNGFPVMVVVGGVALSIALRARLGGRAALACAVVGAFVVGPGSLLLAQRAVTRVHLYPEQMVLYQDLLAVSLRLDRSQLSTSIFPSQDLAAVRKTWLPGNVGLTVYPADSPVVFRPFEDGGTVNHVVRHDWLRMVERHPLAYVAERVNLQTLQLSLTQPTQYSLITSSDMIGPISLRFVQRFPGLNAIRLGYVQGAGSKNPSAGPIFRIWPYVLLGLVGSVGLLLQGARLRLFGRVTLALQVLLQIVLCFTAPVVEFRFESFELVLGVALVALWSGTLAHAPPRAPTRPAKALRGRAAALRNSRGRAR